MKENLNVSFIVCRDRGGVLHLHCVLSCSSIINLMRIYCKDQSCSLGFYKPVRMTSLPLSYGSFPEIEHRRKRYKNSVLIPYRKQARHCKATSAFEFKMQKAIFDLNK